MMKWKLWVTVLFMGGFALSGCGTGEDVESTDSSEETTLLDSGSADELGQTEQEAKRYGQLYRGASCKSGQYPFARCTSSEVAMWGCKAAGTNQVVWVRTLACNCGWSPKPNTVKCDF